MCWRELPRYQSSWGQHGAHLGPVGPRWAPCWPHDPCYLGMVWGVRSRATHIDVNKLGHYHQSGLIVNWTSRNKIQWGLNKNNSFCFKTKRTWKYRHQDGGFFVSAYMHLKSHWFLVSKLCYVSWARKMLTYEPMRRYHFNYPRFISLINPFYSKYLFY